MSHLPNDPEAAIRSAVAAMEPHLIAVRRDIHAHPELGMEEARTSALVAAKLREWGLETTEGVGGPGVVATLRGKRPGQGAIGLRADMDALAMTEQTGLPHAAGNGAGRSAQTGVAGRRANNRTARRADQRAAGGTLARIGSATGQHQGCRKSHNHCRTHDGL